MGGHEYVDYWMGHGALSRPLPRGREAVCRTCRARTNLGATTSGRSAGRSSSTPMCRARADALHSTPCRVRRRPAPRDARGARRERPLEDSECKGGGATSRLARRAPVAAVMTPDVRGALYGRNHRLHPRSGSHLPAQRHQVGGGRLQRGDIAAVILEARGRGSAGDDATFPATSKNAQLTTRYDVRVDLRRGHHRFR